MKTKSPRPESIETLKQKVVATGNLPRHVAVIMDGNGRWAKARGLPRIAGHREGVRSVRVITEIAGELGIETLTLYTFSKENWRRPRWEVSALMNLLLETIEQEVNDLDRNNVRLTVIGRLQDLPEAPRRSMERAIERTAKNTGLNLNLALSYSGRMEILEAVQHIAQKVQAGELRLDQIDEAVFATHLYTAGIPDPDLLIRTSGELRLSNFLLWQSAYTEIFVTPIYWPDFREKEFLEAIASYQKRERRFGKVSEQLQSPGVDSA